MYPRANRFYLLLLAVVLLHCCAWVQRDRLGRIQAAVHTLAVPERWGAGRMLLAGGSRMAAGAAAGTAAFPGISRTDQLRARTLSVR